MLDKDSRLRWYEKTWGRRLCVIWLVLAIPALFIGYPFFLYWLIHR